MRISDWSSDVCSSDLLFGYLRLGRLQVRGARIKCGLTDRVRFQLRLVAAIDRLRQFGTGAQRIEPRDIVGGAQPDEHGARPDVFAQLEADLVDSAGQFRTQVSTLSRPKAAAPVHRDPKGVV